jgi:ABC-type oligopeptide transport system ATPase subunit
MARPQSIAKMGYYPVDPRFTEQIASMFRPSPDGGRILDPCAGEGAALWDFSTAFKMQPYANELDPDRAKACVEAFGEKYVINDDAANLRITGQSFPFVWCNPPYSTNVMQEVGDTKRVEVAFLKKSVDWVQWNGGILAWCVYSHHVTENALEWLARRSKSIDVWAWGDEKHLGRYTQVIVIAVLGRPNHDPAQYAHAIVEDVKAGNIQTAFVHEQPIYEIPAQKKVDSFVFSRKNLPPAEKLVLHHRYGVVNMASFQAQFRVESGERVIRPIVTPRKRQLAVIIASGILNGVVIKTELGKALIRSKITREDMLTDVEEKPEKDNLVREHYQIVPRVSITLLYEDGSIEDITEDEALLKFIQAFQNDLLAYLEKNFNPLYKMDYHHLNKWLSVPKNGGLYDSQKHVIAAVNESFNHRKATILVGEMGVGKTVMGATIAATLIPKMKQGEVVIITCPGHLTEKWRREILDAHKASHVEILKTTTDVRLFMEHARLESPATLFVGIVGRESAKLGEGWSPSVVERQTTVALWPYGEERPYYISEEKYPNRIFKTSEFFCPTCGNSITKDLEDKESLRDRDARKWLEREPRFCKVCKQPLWQDDRTFSKPKTKGTPKPKREADYSLAVPPPKPSLEPIAPIKNPRYPLATYISRRYKNQLFLYIADELHELKGMGTDQGVAMTMLANAATHVLGLTGTLYGGVASSLYNIEYAFNEHVRKAYPWRSLNQWIADMGVLEYTVDTKDTYNEAGKFTGRKRYGASNMCEAPGTSPLLVKEILDHTLMYALADTGRPMPPFKEIPVAIPMSEMQEVFYTEAEGVLSSYLAICRKDGDASFLGAYLQSLLSWPSSAYRTENVIHRIRNKVNDDITEYQVHTIPGITDEIFPKEQWTIDKINEELAKGRGVAVFVRQTGEKRDIRPRIMELIKKYCPLARPFLLKSTVATDKREDELMHAVSCGSNVLVCNPRLVQTGLDLIEFPTIIFYEVDYSFYVMGQASRRAWRIIQNRDCEVYYPYYMQTFEERAVMLVGEKALASAVLVGSDTQGLSSLTKSSGTNSLLEALAKSLDGGSSSNAIDVFEKFYGAEVAAEQDNEWSVQSPFEIVLEMAEQIAEAQFVEPVQEIPVPELTIVKKPKQQNFMDLLRMASVDARKKKMNAKRG